MAKALHRLGHLELMWLAKGVVQSAIVPWQDLLNIPGARGQPGCPRQLKTRTFELGLGSQDLEQDLLMLNVQNMGEWSITQTLHGAGIFTPKHDPVLYVNIPYMEHLGIITILIIILVRFHDIPCQVFEGQGSVALRATPSYRKRSRWMGSMSQRCKSWIRAGSTWGDFSSRHEVTRNDPLNQTWMTHDLEWSRSWGPDSIATGFCMFLVLFALWYPSLQQRHWELPPVSIPTVQDGRHASVTLHVAAAASKINAGFHWEYQARIHKPLVY